MTSDLRQLRNLALERARQRNEKATTVHLLAATWAFGGPAQMLLEDRRLDGAKLLSAARAFDESSDDAIGDVLSSARDVARRGAVPSRASFRSTHGDVRPAAPPEPSAIHVLQVLLSHRHYAAYRALKQCGVDIVKLRTAATRIALGVIQPPRKPRLASQRAARARAVQVPLIPPLRKAHRVVEPPPPAPPEPAAAPESEPSTVDELLAVDEPKEEEPFDALWIDPERFPTLSPLTNMTLEAASGQLGHVIGRDVEVEQALDVLGKRRANNPILVGPSGVGKTTVARAIARRFLEEPAETRRVLLELPAGELLAGTSARGSLAERLGSLLGEVRDADGRAVLFIDEIHELFASGALDEVVGELRSALSAGSLPVIGTTTPGDYARVVAADATLQRRFSVVEVAEPNEADAFLMLRAAVEGLSDHHSVDYSDEAIAVSVSWSIRYLPGRALPDKALAVLDLAGARLARRGDDEQVLVEHVARVVAELADVPEDRLLQTDADRMLDLSKLLRRRVVGHDAACEKIAAVLRRNAAGLRGRRPIGTFLLLGPTGVGKTEMAKAIARRCFTPAMP